MAANTNAAAVTTGECWSCGEMRAAHFCGACGKVQPPVPVDFFSFFGLPRKLEIDIAALQRDFYELSRKLHPDVYVRIGGLEQEWSEQQSSQLNDAYRTLKDPIRRTEYLLKLEGVQLEEQSKAATEQARATGEAKKQVLPPELLEEIFELNLELEEMRMSKQLGERDPELVKELGKQKQHLEAQIESMFAELKGYWQQWDRLPAQDGKDQAASAGERKQVRDKMVDLLNRRNYIRNLVRDVNEALEA
jgi:molecular chaperone HscB